MFASPTKNLHDVICQLYVLRENSPHLFILLSLFVCFHFNNIADTRPLGCLDANINCLCSSIAFLRNDKGNIDAFFYN